MFSFMYFLFFSPPLLLIVFLTGYRMVQLRTLIQMNGAQRWSTNNDVVFFPGSGREHKTTC